MDPKEKISKFFTYKDALWLPEENRMATEADGVTPEILECLKHLFAKMDVVREYFGKPIRVHITFRTMQYHLNLYKQINAKRVAKGLPEVRVPMGSGHLKGKATDFDVMGMSCDDAKAKILADKKLDEWNMRMENNGKGASWVHLDELPVGPSGRYFPV